MAEGVNRDYDGLIMTSEPTGESFNRGQTGPGKDALVEEAAGQLRKVLGDLAARLRPFPAFMNMVSLQAVELEPMPGTPENQGCVVVSPDGQICQLDLKVMPGLEGVTEFDSVEEFTELELAPVDYITYAAAAIRLLYQELQRRGE